jgi:hypothetical protein
MIALISMGPVAIVVDKIVIVIATLLTIIPIMEMRFTLHRGAVRA